MFSLSSFAIPIPTFLKPGTTGAIELRPVETHDVETQPDRRARALKHLLKLNHVNHSIIYHDLQYHNHMPHLLGSAYILGANETQLEALYAKESEELDKWRDSPAEVSKHDWRDFLGDRSYQRAYVDFFEDELVLDGYDWRKVLDEYMFQGEEPLVNCLIAGLGHPLIHLGYAYEFSSRELAMEALGLATTSYNFLHKYLDNPQFCKPSTYTSSSPLEILQKVGADKRFDEHGSIENMESLFEDHEELMLEHWNAWKSSDAKEQFKDSQFAAASLLAGTQKSSKSYDFFLVHILTSSHAIRILLPLVPTKHQTSLIRQWWLLTLAVYVVQCRPAVDENSILTHDVTGKSWEWVRAQATGGRWSADAHFIKALRALEEAAMTWEDKSSFYLKSAVKLCDEFNGWTFQH